MYEIKIKHTQAGEETGEFVNTKSEAVAFIARETGYSRKSIEREISAKQDSQIYRDNDDTRIWVWYTK